jgi:cytochrome c-type biogenesis protein
MISFNLFSLSLLAGALAAFNPCGFVLLPAYLTSLIVSEDTEENKALIYLRAVRFSLGMTTGFIAVFGTFALVIAPVAGSVEKYLPIITIAVGAALLVLAVSLLLEKNLFLKKLANPNIAPNKNWGSQVGYGITFALVSLSCTIGPFLAITAAAISAKSFLRVISLFVSYSLGMGVIVLTLAFAVAAAKSKLIGRIRRSQRLISKLSGIFLLIVGGYEMWYGYFEIQTLKGQASSDPAIRFASALQSRLTQFVASLGTPFLLSLIILMAGILALRGRRSQRHERVSSTNSGAK